MDTVEVIVTGTFLRHADGLITLTGMVRYAEAPAAVIFTLPENDISGTLGALAAGESPTIDLPTRMLIGL